MPAFAIRRVDGKLRIRAAGCCNPASYRREYERAYMEQVLRDGGSVVRRGGTWCTSWTAAAGPARSISEWK